MAKATKPAKVAAKAKATNRNTARKARNAAKASAVVVQPPHTVPGWPAMQIVEGRGCDDNTVAGVISANNGADDVAITNDGKSHVATAIIRAGVSVKRGLNWVSINSTYLALQRKERDNAEASKAVLAKGTETERHCRKAVADQKGTTKMTAKTAKAEKATARKASKAAKAAPKTDDTRKPKLLDKKFSFGGDGTARRASWDALLATVKGKGTVADYSAKGGKVKYLPRWVSAGAIALS